VVVKSSGDISAELVRQWFPNFFKRDPNPSLMNISRPKPKTSKKMYFTCLGSENVSGYSTTRPT